MSDTEKKTNHSEEQKHSELVLQESELRYRRLVEAVTDYIYTVKVENAQVVSTAHGANCISVTGYSSEEYQADQDLWLKMVHPDDRHYVVQQAQRILNGKTIQPIEHRIYHKDGTIRWVRNTPVPHCDASGRLVSYDGLIYNVTERKIAQEQLKEHARRLEILNCDLVRREQELLKANHEKEILLKEIHHRVKNNLQIIHSLINLQIHNIADRSAVGLLKECQNRIKTIAMVHEKMYQLGDLTRVEVGSYLQSLTSHINRVYLRDWASVTIRVDAKNIYLPIDQAIPCALIVNELVCNSLKHAFPGRGGEINVHLAADKSGDYVLTLSDNGVGFPAGTDYRDTKSLGMQLVATFVNQLQGTIERVNKPGTAFKITFAQSQKEG